MSEPSRFVSVKFSPVGRPRVFLLDQLALERPMPGESVVVHTETGDQVGAVVPTIPGTAERHHLPPDSSQRVVRRATEEDVILKLKRQQREEEARRVALLLVERVTAVAGDDKDALMRAMTLMEKTL
jgi:hypothetical protein